MVNSSLLQNKKIQVTSCLLLNKLSTGKSVQFICDICLHKINHEIRIHKFWKDGEKLFCLRLSRGSDLDSGNFEAEETSIRHLASEVSISFEELLRGDQSFGGFIEDSGFVAVPAPDHLGPDGDSYFRL